MHILGVLEKFSLSLDTSLPIMESVGGLTVHGFLSLLRCMVQPYFPATRLALANGIQVQVMGVSLR